MIENLVNPFFDFSPLPPLRVRHELVKPEFVPKVITTYYSYRVNYGSLAQKDSNLHNFKSMLEDTNFILLIIFREDPSPIV